MCNPASNNIQFLKFYLISFVLEHPGGSHFSSVWTEIYLEICSNQSNVERDRTQTEHRARPFGGISTVHERQVEK